MFTEDLDTYFNTNHHASSISFNLVDVVVIAEEILQVTSENTGGLIETRIVIGKTSEIGGVVVGEEVVIDTVSWTVAQKISSSGICTINFERRIS